MIVRRWLALPWLPFMDAGAGLVPPGNRGAARESFRYSWFKIKADGRTPPRPVIRISLRLPVSAIIKVSPKSYR